jgi:hypothetical protein
MRAVIALAVIPEDLAPGVSFPDGCRVLSMVVEAEDVLPKLSSEDFLQEMGGVFVKQFLLENERKPS